MLKSDNYKQTLERYNKEMDRLKEKWRNDDITDINEYHNKILYFLEVYMKKLKKLDICIGDVLKTKINELYNEGFSFKKIEIYSKDSGITRDGYPFAQKPVLTIDASKLNYLGDDEKGQTEKESLINNSVTLYNSSTPFILNLEKENGYFVNFLLIPQLAEHDLLGFRYYCDQNKKPQKFERMGIDGEILETVIPGENLFENLIKKIFHRNN